MNDKFGPRSSIYCQLLRQNGIWQVKNENQKSHCSTFNDMNPIKAKKIHYFIGKEKKDILGICDDNENLGEGKQVFLFCLIYKCLPPAEMYSP